MAPTNNFEPSHRRTHAIWKFPFIHGESPSVSDQTRFAPAQLDADSFPYGMYNHDPSSMSSSSLVSLQGFKSLNLEFSPLEDLSADGLYRGEPFCNITEQSQDLFSPAHCLTGPEPFGPPPDGFQVIPPSPPPQTMLRNTSGNICSSSYAALSPSLSHESPPSLHFNLTTPSSEGSSYVASQAMLEAIQRRRRTEATYRCDECGQTFTAMFSLKRHMQSHSGIRPFVCNIPGCHQTFFNQLDCRRHERSRKRHKGLPHTFSESP